MGVWSHNPFDNDAAADWLERLLEGDDLEPVASALDAVLAVPDGYIDADLASEAIAAAEVLARLAGAGTPHDDDTSELDRWVAAHTQLPTDELRPMAARALDRVVGDRSELRELWDESDDAGVWRSTIAGLARHMRH